MQTQRGHTRPPAKTPHLSFWLSSSTFPQRLSAMLAQYSPRTRAREDMCANTLVPRPNPRVAQLPEERAGSNAYMSIERTTPLSCSSHPCGHPGSVPITRLTCPARALLELALIRTDGCLRQPPFDRPKPLPRYSTCQEPSTPGVVQAPSAIVARGLSSSWPCQSCGRSACVLATWRREMGRRPALDRREADEDDEDGWPCQP